MVVGWRVWNMLPLARIAGKKEQLALAVQRLEKGGALLLALGRSGRSENVAKSQSQLSAVLINSLEGICEREKACGVLFPQLLLQMYDHDVLPEEHIVLWADAAARSPPDSARHRFCHQSSAMLKWLREAESEDDEH